MAGYYGRDVAFAWNALPVLGIREKGITINGEAVNVTSDEDDGIQYLLNTDAERSWEIAISGVTKDAIFRVAKASGAIQDTVLITYPDGATIAGTFNLASYSEGIPYNEAVTFQATLQSTGPVVYTPAP